MDGGQQECGPARRVETHGLSFAVVDRKESFWERVSAGTWEPEMMAALPGLAARGRLLVDIGAWVGPVTLVSASAGAEVIAFEPDPEAFAALSANLAANPALGARVRAMPAAVQATAGTMPYASPRKPGDGMGGKLWSASGQAPRSVPATGVADVVAMLGDRHDILLKLDIEGGEYELLPVLAPLIRRAGACLVSLHPKVVRQAAGLGEERIAALTEAALGMLAGFDLRFLDHDRAQPVSVAEAMRRDCAILAERRSGA
jgi:FkbM family methyltransferase